MLLVPWRLKGKSMSFWLLDDATVWESQVLKGSSPRWRVVSGEAGDVCAPRSTP